MGDLGQRWKFGGKGGVWGQKRGVWVGCVNDGERWGLERDRQGEGQGQGKGSGRESGAGVGCGCSGEGRRKGEKGRAGWGPTRRPN